MRRSYTLSPELVDGLTTPLSRECGITTHICHTTPIQGVGGICGFAEPFGTADLNTVRRRYCKGFIAALPCMGLPCMARYESRQVDREVGYRGGPRGCLGGVRLLYPGLARPIIAWVAAAASRVGRSVALPFVIIHKS